MDTWWYGGTWKQPTVCLSPRRLLLLILVFILCSPLLGASASAREALVVEWQADRLSVVADHTPLSQILQEIARRTGLEVQGFEGLQEEVSVGFADLLLRDGLEKLLADTNYSLIEKTDPQGDVRLTRVLILGRRTTRLSAVRPQEQGRKLEWRRADDGVMVFGGEEAPPEEPVPDVMVFGGEEAPPEEPASEVVLPERR